MAINYKRMLSWTEVSTSRHIFPVLDWAHCLKYDTSCNDYNIWLFHLTISRMINSTDQTIRLQVVHWISSSQSVLFALQAEWLRGLHRGVNYWRHNQQYDNLNENESWWSALLWGFLIKSTWNNKLTSSWCLFNMAQILKFSVLHLNATLNFFWIDYKRAQYFPQQNKWTVNNKLPQIFYSLSMYILILYPYELTIGPWRQNFNRCNIAHIYGEFHFRGKIR
jgi:hypothetical protein